VSPSWPLFERRYGELLAPARDELGESWQVEVDRGAGEPLDQVVASVLGRAAVIGDRAPAGGRSATSSDR
jgi:hypothetical protein